jgi:hypothetical protein
MHAYLDLAIGQDDRAAGYQMLAGNIFDHYQKKMGIDQPRVRMPPMNDLKRAVLDQLLDATQGLPFAARAVLRTQLGMPAETNSPPASTISTNAIAPIILSDTNIPASTNK